MLARSGFDNYDYHVNIVLVKGSNLRKKITIISEPYFAYFVTFSWIIYQEHFISKWITSGENIRNKNKLILGFLCVLVELSSFEKVKFLIKVND